MCLGPSGLVTIDHLSFAGAIISDDPVVTLDLRMTILNHGSAS